MHIGVYPPLAVIFTGARPVFPKVAFFSFEPAMADRLVQSMTSLRFLGLLPILWSTGAGAEVMKRIVAPMVGGLATSFLMELIVYPALYERWKSRTLPRE